MRAILILLILLLSLQSALAIEGLEQLANINIEGVDLSSAILSYNDNISNSVPPALLAVFGNERINLNISGEIVGVALEDGKVVNVTEGAIPNPTLNFTVTQKAIEELSVATSTEAIIATAQDLLKSKEVDYKGVGASGFKYTLIKILQKIYFFIKGIFSIFNK